MVFEPISNPSQNLFLKYKFPKYPLTPKSFPGRYTTACPSAWLPRKQYFINNVWNIGSTQSGWNAEAKWVKATISTHIYWATGVWFPPNDTFLTTTKCSSSSGISIHEMHAFQIKYRCQNSSFSSRIFTWKDRASFQLIAIFASYPKHCNKVLILYSFRNLLKSLFKI